MPPLPAMPNRVVSVRAGEVRALDSLGVVDDPWPRDIPDACHQRNGAHALITTWDGLGAGARRHATLLGLQNILSSYQCGTPESRPDVDELSRSALHWWRG